MTDLGVGTVTGDPYQNSNLQESSQYQDSLITKICDDPNIGDKQAFLTKLIKRVSS